jgi:hypothetical protein
LHQWNHHSQQVLDYQKYSQACKDYFSDVKNIGDLQAIFLAKLQEKEMGVLAEKPKKRYTHSEAVPMRKRK